MIPEAQTHNDYYLSTEEFYFKYRRDSNDDSIIRATLFRTKDHSVADDVRVSEGYGLPEKTHHQVINHFEARITMGHIKPSLPLPDRETYISNVLKEMKYE